MTPKDFIGSLMELAQERRGDFKEMKYITESRASIIYELPLAEVWELSLFYVLAGPSKLLPQVHAVSLVCCFLLWHICVKIVSLVIPQKL